MKLKYSDYLSEKVNETLKYSDYLTNNNPISKLELCSPKNPISKLDLCSPNTITSHNLTIKKVRTNETVDKPEVEYRSVPPIDLDSNLDWWCKKNKTSNNFWKYKI